MQIIGYHIKSKHLSTLNIYRVMLITEFSYSKMEQGHLFLRGCFENLKRVSKPRTYTRTKVGVSPSGHMT